MRKTKKYYYDQPLIYKTKSHVVNVFSNQEIELDKTIAFPEGGGQESDTGTITHVATGKSIRFVHVKRICCGSFKVEDNKSIKVDGLIVHVPHQDDADDVVGFSAGDEVLIEICTERREKLSTSHSASHLLYLGVGEVRSDIVQNTLGCHIREGQARFDFKVDSPISKDELTLIEDIANNFVLRDSDIKLFASDEHEDARYWECEGHVIPCGGTHLDKTGNIGKLSIFSKSLGKGKIRVTCKLDNPTYVHSKYFSEA